MVRTVVFGVALCVALSGCGGGNGGPGAAVDGFLEVSKHMGGMQDMEKMRPHLTKESWAQMEQMLAFAKQMEGMAPEGMRAEAEKKRAEEQREKMADLTWEILDETIDGDTARVKVRATGEAVEEGQEEATFVCRKEDGVWKIDMQASDWGTKATSRSGGMQDEPGDEESEGTMPDPEAMQKAMEAFKKAMEEGDKK